MNILISGASGLIGSELASALSKNGHQILRLVRGVPARADEIQWNPEAGTLDIQSLEGIDAAVHLAGENIGNERWTAQKMRRIRESRLQGTRLLAQSLSRLFDPPKVLVSVSAVGYYGNRGDEKLDEESGPGEGFLPQLCEEWERATEPAIIRGIRVAIPRLGMVLSEKGGSLPLMFPAFRLGIGCGFGNGRQYMSWIAIEDLVGVIQHMLHKESLHGPVNAVSPNPVRSHEFFLTLGRLLGRPARFPIPSIIARIALGKMAKEVLLSSAKAAPKRLMQSGYKFKYPDLEGALRRILKQSGLRF
jgi:uncharacterized protein